MDDKMGLTNHLQQTLKSLCFSTEWKYAVFWKLKQRSRMMLTWEDAYYDSHELPDPSDFMSSNYPQKKLRDGSCLRDPLGLAVAKMSYLVYPLEEGIVGQVAASGKHQWIFADKPASSFRSSSEFCDGWQTQFSAGIRTIAVVAVAPLGVVQLGSLNKVTEDMKLVTHIKNVFGSARSSSFEFIPDPTDHSMPRTLCPESTQSSVLEVSNDITYLCPGMYNELSYNTLPLSSVFERNAVEVVDEHFRVESLASRDYISNGIFHPKSGIFNLEQQNQIQIKSTKMEYGNENTGWRHMLVRSNGSGCPVIYNVPEENLSVDNYVALPVDKTLVDYSLSPSGLHYSTVWGSVRINSLTCLQNEELELPQPSKLELGKGLQKNSGMQTEVSRIDTEYSLKFSACSELHEALGTAFQKEQDPCAWSELMTETGIHIHPPEGMCAGQFTTEYKSEQLLDAVVAKTRPCSSNIESEGSLCKSAVSILTTEKAVEALNHLKDADDLANGSAIQPSCVVEDVRPQDSNLILDSTKICPLKSPEATPPNYLNTCGKQSEPQVKAAKISRKRTRPGESCKPRPRDRQLIQDRVKELRELVPNSSKCSIDSLLERTIKHMLFLQSVTKHADKLKTCAASKKMGLLGSCTHEHGSSWALEVGNETQGCPIVVENLNMNGQMLVEMLCEDSNNFLEISEAIRRLGLVILHGVMEVRGEKRWACFVIEGQNNRTMHRMDILWSLMQQLLQPKDSNLTASANQPIVTIQQIL